MERVVVMEQVGIGEWNERSGKDVLFGVRNRYEQEGWLSPTERASAG